MNSEVRVPTTTRLFQIKELLVKKHGPMRDLKICKDKFAERNELHDDVLTLEEYGIQGIPADMDPCFQEIFYDYKPADHDDPLLLVWQS